jgi:hypothetical protein
MNGIGAVASQQKASDYDKWQAHDDLMTIVRAKEIQADPKRMKNVQRAAKEKLEEQKALKTIADGGKV